MQTAIYFKKADDYSTEQAERVTILHTVYSIKQGLRFYTVLHSDGIIRQHKESGFKKHFFNAN